MMVIQGKPKLIFFQYKYDPSLPEFLLHQKDEHIKCLAQFFEVTVINADCDYQHICDTVQPDITLVESGVSYPSCRKPKVANTRACPEIPKIGLMNSDGFCRTRASFVSDMDYWGIDTAFAIATTAPEHTPNIVEHMFVWPVFVDDEVYRDYGQWKTIPVLFTGNANSLYPWRQRLMRLVPKYYPSLISPHSGYLPRKTNATADVRVMVGERYAKMLNASQFVLACGTVAKDVVRKHFEIPASRACLLTERSKILEAAGFVDMKNCVFADEGDVLDRLDYLFAHPDELEAITDAGYQLVRSRHTLKQRDEVRQWFELQRNLEAEQLIVQPNPFEPLQIVDRTVAHGVPRITSNGEHLRLLREGDEKLIAGKYEEAENLYTRCWNYIRWMPEPQLRIGICKLCKGNAKAALEWIIQPLHFTLIDCKSDDPDPTEWAYFIIALLCQGRLQAAAERAAQFSWLRHSDLDRVRASISFIINGAGGVDVENDSSTHRMSIHGLPARDSKDWMRHLCLMLRACGQGKLADRLEPSLSERHYERPQPDVESRRGSPEQTRVPAVGCAALKDGDDVFLRRTLSLFGAVKRGCKRAAAFVLQGLETRLGYFLPYHLSSARADEFYERVQKIAERDDIRSALVLGVNSREYITEALLTGIRRNANAVTTLCLPAGNGEQFGSTIEIFKREKDISAFDLVLIDLSELRRYRAVVDGVQYCREANVVIIDDTCEISRYPGYCALVEDSQHIVVADQPGVRGGYAVYERRDWAPGARNKSNASLPYYAAEVTRAGLWI